MRRPSSLSGFSKALRLDLTDHERLLWKHLRACRFFGVHFKRQVPIVKYIVDFFSSDQGLIIELDGGQHAERVTEDAQRTEYLESQGYRVLRFWNSDLWENLDGVLEEIRRSLRLTPPSP